MTGRSRSIRTAAGCSRATRATASLPLRASPTTVKSGLGLDGGAHEPALHRRVVDDDDRRADEAWLACSRGRTPAARSASSSHRAVQRVELDRLGQAGDLRLVDDHGAAAQAVRVAPGVVEHGRVTGTERLQPGQPGRRPPRRRSARRDAWTSDSCAGRAGRQRRSGPSTAAPPRRTRWCPLPPEDPEDACRACVVPLEEWLERGLGVEPEDRPARLQCACPADDAVGAGLGLRRATRRSSAWSRLPAQVNVTTLRAPGARVTTDGGLPGAAVVAGPDPVVAAEDDELDGPAAHVAGAGGLGRCW